MENHAELGSFIEKQNKNKKQNNKTKQKQKQNKQTKNPKWRWYLFNVLTFVNFDMFIIHILRNCYEKLNKYIFK